MRLAFGLSIALLAVLQSGCIIVTSYTKLEPKLAEWDKEQEYGRALNALSQIDPKDPDYARAAGKRKQIKRHASDYEQKVRLESRKLIADGQWAAALDLYDSALKKLPSSVVIRDGLAQLHNQQRIEVDRLNMEQLILHGEWLLSVIPIYKQIVRVDPRSNNAQINLDDIHFEAEEIAAKLALYGNRALADNDTNTADRVLPLALKLDNDPVIAESLKKLRSVQKKNKLATEKARSQRQQDQRALERHFHQAMKKENFHSASNTLEELQRKYPKHSQLHSMSTKLQTAIGKKVAELFDAGVSAYSRGLFEKAAENWKAALKLNPNHRQARENLERAEKVLDNLEKLQQKQGG